MKLVGKYPYVQAIPGAPFRPILYVKIVNDHNPQKSIIITCLLDTGADVCVLPQSACEVLGHNLENGCDSIHIGGITGLITGHLHSNRIVIGAVEEKCDFYICEGMEDENGILGHKGFFDRFQVFFDTRRNYFIIYK